MSCERHATIDPPGCGWCEESERAKERDSLRARLATLEQEREQWKRDLAAADARNVAQHAAAARTEQEMRNALASSEAGAAQLADRLREAIASMKDEGRFFEWMAPEFASSEQRLTEARKEALEIAQWVETEIGSNEAAPTKVLVQIGREMRERIKALKELEP